MSRNKRNSHHRRGSAIGLVVKAIILLILVCVLVNVYQNRDSYGDGSLGKFGEVFSFLDNYAKEHPDEANTGTVSVSDYNMKNYTNIVLFGVDSTEGSLDDSTRTDSIIIMSINNLTKETKLVSVYRDTYLNVGDDKYTKCNAAYAYGGADQAIDMLNSNLDMNISDYITIGFGGLSDIIDDIGGVTITVEEDEIDHLNNYQSTMATELGKTYVPVTAAGEQKLNGLQAVAYCRIRYTAGNDFKRTSRQRDVLMGTINGIRSSSPSVMFSVAKDLSSSTKTSLSLIDVIKLLGGITKYKISDTSGFPFTDGITTANLGSSKGDCVIPVTLSSNVTELHSYLFGTQNYTPSDTVQSYSAQIKSDSGT